MNTVSEKLTPPAIARRTGVSANKVLGWIRSGQLTATNVATDPTGRPRFVVDADEVERFIAGRKVTPTT